MCRESGLGSIVAKFGGSSLVSGKEFENMARIVQDDPRRTRVVVSAPGKRTADDRKITDLLHVCTTLIEQELPFGNIFDIVSERYREIVQELQLTLDIDFHLETIKRGVRRNVWGKDYFVSRGEYLSGIIAAALLNFEFVDAAEIIFFDDYGRLDHERTRGTICRRVNQCECGVVVPGFYGSYPDGRIKTFPRGGSDITGALVAEALGASVYENWTDTDGILAADPGLIPNPKTIQTLTYEELRELTYMGFRVFHEEGMFPARRAGIPIHVRNTRDPSHPGTMIVKDNGIDYNFVTGIAGRKNFTMITVKKELMNAEQGFGRRVLSVIEGNGISYEHTPTGIDTLSIIIANEELKGKIDRVVSDITIECQPDAIEIIRDIALIVVVGWGMTRIPGVVEKIFGALTEVNINRRLIIQGGSACSIIVGVDNRDFETAVKTLYDKLFLMTSCSCKH